MKTSRAAMVAGASATVLVTGWSVSPKMVPTLDLVDPLNAAEPVSMEPGAPIEETFAGPVVNTQRGPVQVEIVVADGQILRVNGLALGSPNAYTIAIVSEAYRVLRERVVEAQTWDVEYSSGASFFSPGFVESVRGAMVEAGLVDANGATVVQPGEASDGSADYEKPGPGSFDTEMPAWTNGQPGAGSSGSTTTAPGTTTPPATAAPAPEPPPTPVSERFTGPAISNEKGTFQAQITVTDGVVTAVKAVQAGTNERQSREINANAIPILAARVISAQSANVEYVSGASYTSPGFLQSVQGALGDAGLA